MNEKRRFRRFKMQDGALVEVKMNGSKIGKIIDISEGGLAFSYIDIGTRPEESFDLDLYFQGKDSRIESIPAKTVSDISIKSLYAITKTRRHGVQFCDLESSQNASLKEFIENFAAGNA